MNSQASARKVMSVIALLSLMVPATVSARSLPQWSQEDRARLKSGDLVPGSLLFSEDDQRLPDLGPPKTKPIPEVVATFEAEPVLDPKMIPEEYLADFFIHQPVGHLIDPQRLLTNQETLDQEGFLEYYADESEVEVRIYLFDADQLIPDQYAIQRIAENLYADAPFTAIVYYFLGNPRRNQIVFAGQGADSVTSDKRRKILSIAKVKAQEKSVAPDQMQSFIQQLSISLFWIEQDLMARRNAEAAKGASSDAQGENSSESAVKANLLSQIQPYLWYGVVGVVSLLATIASLVVAWLVYWRCRRYRFPEIELPRRLGADSAAGIGVVLEFHSKLESPSNQEGEIPDYLRRIR